MKGRYRFLRTKGGRSYFARIALEVQPGGAKVEVIDALPGKVNPDEGEVNQQTALTWVAAALEGMRGSLMQAQKAGILTGGGCATLDELVGSPVDTREDVIRCAAGLAVWDALGAAEWTPEAEFDGQRWKLVYPVVKKSPAQRIAP